MIRILAEWEPFTSQPKLLLLALTEYMIEVVNDHPLYGLATLILGVLLSRGCSSHLSLRYSSPSPRKRAVFLTLPFCSFADTCSFAVPAEGQKLAGLVCQLETRPRCFLLLLIRLSALLSALNEQRSVI